MPNTHQTLILSSIDISTFIILSTLDIVNMIHLLSTNTKKRIPQIITVPILLSSGIPIYLGIYTAKVYVPSSFFVKVSTRKVSSVPEWL